MIPDYKCNAVYFSEWLKSDYLDIYKGLAKILNRYNVAYDVIPNTKDVWCRDYMPLQLDKERYLCYEYKPDKEGKQLEIYYRFIECMPGYATENKGNSHYYRWW